MPRYAHQAKGTGTLTGITVIRIRETESDVCAYAVAHAARTPRYPLTGSQAPERCPVHGYARTGILTHAPSTLPAIAVQPFPSFW
jgi:hypothetical protein